MLRIILFTISLVCSLSLSAQQFRDYVKAGDQAYEQNNYFEALTRYGDAMDVYDGSIEVTYRYAESARQFNAYRMASKAYQTVLRSDQAKNYPYAPFWLGTLKKQLGKYDQAKQLFEKFLKEPPSDNIKILEARKHIKDCEWSLAIVEQADESLEIKQLSGEVNTPYSDFGAIERGDTLYYTSDRFENEYDAYTPNRHISKVLTSVAGTQGKPIRDGFNTRRSHTAHTAFNTKGNKIFYTVCEYVSTADIRCALFVKKLEANGNWSPGTKLPEAINPSQFTNTQPSVGMDDNGDEILYFTSDRTGGQGGMDIWATTLQTNGTYGQVMNLSTINTAEDDITPYFDNKEKILYFSTKGYPTLGGFDIYKAAKVGTNWQAPQHLGAPINGSFNDIYYSVNMDGSRAYLASNRLGSQYIEREKEACCNDIYSVELGEIILDLTALTFDSLTMKELKGVQVQLEDANGQRLDGKFNTKANDFLFKIDPSMSYRLIATKDGYSTATRELTVGDGSKIRSYQEKLVLGKLPAAPIRPLELEALVYDKSRRALSGATVYLVNQLTNKKINVTNPANNDFDFLLERETPYLLIAEKAGYTSSQVIVEPSSMIAISTITKQLYLEKNIVRPSAPVVTRVTLDGYLPLPVFFDNDQPDSRTRRITTQKTYGESYNAYYARKGIFKQEYSKGMAGEQRIIAESDIEYFFEDKVRRGNDNLEAFSNQLLRYLQQGESAEIKIKGFASPRAKSDYNKSLTKRRISSLRNHFERWSGGALVQYINNRQLKITEVPFGEDQAASVSDKIDDTKNSIYSVGASQERRVEIVEIKY